MKIARSWALLLLMLAGCASAGPARVESIDSFSRLTDAVALDRVRLDSVVAQIHALSGDTSRRSLNRLQQLRSNAVALDSRYRADVAELFTAVSASTAGLPASDARFPASSSTPFVRAFADGANWMLQSPLIYQIGNDPAAIVIVPRGFITDFASMPQPLKALRDLLPSTERYGIPALVHDYLYWRQDCTREQADNIMDLAMKEAGVSTLERTLVYRGLRQLGQAAWDENKRARQSGLTRTVGAPYDQIPLTASWTEYREWLRTIGARPGLEYPVPQSVCRRTKQE